MDNSGWLNKRRLRLLAEGRGASRVLEVAAAADEKAADAAYWRWAQARGCCCCCCNLSAAAAAAAATACWR